MALTEAQFARAAAQERNHQRLAELSRMSGGELHALLTGEASQAAAWVRSAAECGLPAAQVRLGRMLLEGAGVPRDTHQALAWFARAAARRHPDALNMVGRCHENGWGVPVDLERAAASYRVSADLGHDWGQYNLGNLLFDGRGIVRDRLQALRCYLRAARQGHARAMNLAGRCHEEGWGCRRDLIEAALWYCRSAERGYFRGQFNHAITLASAGMPEAADWFLKAAHGGNAGMRRAILELLSTTKRPALVQARQYIASINQ